MLGAGIMISCFGGKQESNYFKSVTSSQTLKAMPSSDDVRNGIKGLKSNLILLAHNTCVVCFCLTLSMEIPNIYSLPISIREQNIQ